MENERQSYPDHDLLVRLDERMQIFTEQIKNKATVEEILEIKHDSQRQYNELKEFIAITIAPIRDQLENTVEDVSFLKKFKDGAKNKFVGGFAVVTVVAPVVYIVIEGALKKAFKLE